MRRLFQAVPILCTLLLVGLGVSMPRLVSLALDQQLENAVSLLENQGISLAFEQETDFFQTLELFGSVTSQIKLSGGYRMKPEDVEIAAAEARLRVAPSGGEYGSPEVTPVLVTSKSIPGLSGIFWRCIWHDTMIDTKTILGMQEILWLDDQSGKMVSFSGFSGLVEWSSLSAPNRLFPQFAVDAAEYCRLYYPVDMVRLALTDEDDLGLFTITLTRNQNGQDETYSIPLRIVDGWIFFNEMLF